MCNFLSAIILKNLDVIWDLKYPEQHEELIKKYNLVDDKIGLYLERFCRVKFIPSNLNELRNKDNWNLNIDENSTPNWFDEAIITNKLWIIISNMFVQGERGFLEKGCFILLDGAEVEDVNNCNIPYMVGNSDRKSVV